MYSKIRFTGSREKLPGTRDTPDWRVRMGAALALTAIGDTKSVSYLEIATRDENEFVRKIASAGIGKKEEKRS